MTCLIINNSAITKQEKIQQQTMRNQALFQPTTTTLPTRQLFYPKEVLKLDFYLVNNIQPP